MIVSSLQRLLICALTLSVCSSCMKTPKLADQEDGVQVESLEVQKAVARAWGDADPALLLRKNDFTFIETEQTIQSFPARVTSQSGITVSERSISADQESVHHRVLFQLKEIEADGSYKLSTTAEDFDVTNTLPAANLTASQLNAQNLKALGIGDGQVRQNALSIDVAANLFNICAMAVPENVKLQCYNLTTSSEVRPAPALVAAQSNCGGLPDCVMHVSNVAFDVLVTSTNEDGETTQKIKFSAAITNDVPYFAKVLDYCTTGLVDVPSAGQKVLVKVCDYVRNFQYGEADHF